jgi:hypothetical protein
MYGSRLRASCADDLWPLLTPCSCCCSLLHCRGPTRRYATAPAPPPLPPSTHLFGVDVAAQGDGAADVVAHAVAQELGGLGRARLAPLDLKRQAAPARAGGQQPGGDLQVAAGGRGPGPGRSPPHHPSLHVRLLGVGGSAAEPLTARAAGGAHARGAGQPCWPCIRPGPSAEPARSTSAALRWAAPQAACLPQPAHTQRPPPTPPPTPPPPSHLGGDVVQHLVRLGFAAEADAPVDLGAHALAPARRLHRPLVPPVRVAPQVCAHRLAQPPHQLLARAGPQLAYLRGRSRRGRGRRQQREAGVPWRGAGSLLHAAGAPPPPPPGLCWGPTSRRAPW